MIFFKICRVHQNFSYLMVKNFSIVSLGSTFIVSPLTWVSFWMSSKLHFKLILDIDMDTSLSFTKVTQCSFFHSIYPPLPHLSSHWSNSFFFTGCPWMVKFLSSYIVENVFNSFPYLSGIFIWYRFWVKILCPKIFDVSRPSASSFADKKPNIELVIVLS